MADGSADYLDGLGLQAGVAGQVLRLRSRSSTEIGEKAPLTPPARMKDTGKLGVIST